MENINNNLNKLAIINNKYAMANLTIYKKNGGLMAVHIKKYNRELKNNSPTKYNQKAKKDFLVKYHHDMREPLRNISSFLQIIKMDLINKNDLPVNNTDLLYYINNAINCLNILDDFNNSILNYSSNSKQKPHTLNSIINKIVCLLSNQLIKRKCTVDIQDDFPLLKCSPIDLFRIFKNLIENSIKYAKCDELFIKISFINKLNDNIILLFEDNGTQLDHSTILEITRTLQNRESSSCGLPIIKELITKNHGSIKFLDDRKGCSYELIFKSL